MAVVSSSWTLASAFRFACASAVLRPTNLRRGLRVTDCVVDSTLGAGDLALACASMKDAVRKLTRKMMWFQILELFQKDWTQHLGAELLRATSALSTYISVTAILPAIWARPAAGLTGSPAPGWPSLLRFFSGPAGPLGFN